MSLDWVHTAACVVFLGVWAMIGEIIVRGQ